VDDGRIIIKTHILPSFSGVLIPLEFLRIVPPMKLSQILPFLG